MNYIDFHDNLKNITLIFTMRSNASHLTMGGGEGGRGVGFSHRWREKKCPSLGQRKANEFSLGNNKKISLFDSI